jgi:hypothetical protein
MRITEISISSTYGIHGAIKFIPQSVTVLSGDNGTGKSSVLRALLYVFNGGTDPSVIHSAAGCQIPGCAGADQSVVAFKLDDGTQAVKTTRPKRTRKGSEITGYTSEVEITQPDGTVRKAPMDYIRELGEAIAVDPGAILRIDSATVPGRKQLAEILLKICPISFTLEELDATTACRSSVEVQQPDTHMSKAVFGEATTLDGIKKLTATIAEQRRRAGVLRDDADGAVKSLRRSLPADSGGADYDAMLADAEEYRRQVEAAIAGRKREIDAQFSEARGKAVEQQNEGMRAVNEEIDARIRGLEEERNRRNNLLREQRDRLVRDSEEEKSSAFAELEPEQSEALETSIAEAEKYRNLRDAHIRAAGLRGEIERQDKIAFEQAWIYSQLSSVLERLEALRRSKLDHLPAGIEIASDVVTIDGIPWHNVNLAKRVEICMQLCAMHAGSLPLIIADDSEHLGEEAWGALCQGIVDSGFQLVAARVVSNSPLKIETQP